MLDTASPSQAALSPEMVSLAQIASDVGRDLDERLEAYEDIIDSEIGDTDLMRARNIEREVGMRQLFLKFEGANPSGTQKDRIAFAQAQDALRRGFDTITVATCGNYGAAVAHAAAMAGLRCVIFIPSGYKTRREAEMVERGAEIERVPGDYEGAVDISRERAQKKEYYDANPGGANLDLQLRAYGSIAHEIYDELRDAPAAVAIPVSNGTTLAGVHRGFVSLYRRGKTSRVPHMIAGSSVGKNPIVGAWLAGHETCEDIAPEKIHETAVNEPLINWHSIDGDLALDAIRSSGGWAAHVSDKALLSQAKTIREQQGLNPLPASTAGLFALLDRHRREPLPGDRYVVLLTGRK
ncbi:MAG TPA: pyridoxal-phosphate dependent enzyme [Rhodothermales bacterium]